MDDTATELACILADCGNADDLSRYLMKHAVIVPHLVCLMGKEVRQSEAGIRTLYATWADMAAEQFQEPRTVPGKKLH